MKQIKTKEEEEELRDLNNNPFLKKLLINYCLIHYEQDAITDDEHLLREYYYLKQINSLDELFNCERITLIYSDNKTI